MQKIAVFLMMIAVMAIVGIVSAVGVPTVNAPIVSLPSVGSTDGSDQVTVGIYKPCPECYNPYPSVTPTPTPAPVWTDVGLDFSISSSSIKAGQSVTLSAYTLGGVPLKSPNFSWSYGSSGKNGQTITVKLTKKGTYSFQVTMLDYGTMQKGYVKKSNILKVL